VAVLNDVILSRLPLGFVGAGISFVPADRPRQSPGLRELVFLHAVAVVTAAVARGRVQDAYVGGIVDGVLVLLIAVVYRCTRGWRSWRTGDGSRQHRPVSHPGHSTV
jgi:hypothetical protein